jgi:hypothetical protein
MGLFEATVALLLSGGGVAGVVAGIRARLKR